MSSVLRPLYVSQKVVKEITVNPDVNLVTENSLPIQAQAQAVPQVITTENISVSEVVSSPETQDDVVKDEKISAVLQEILERKIDKAIINAEAEINNIAPVVASAQEAVSVTMPDDTQMVSQAPLEQVKVVPVPTAGQEIHVPVLQEDILPTVEVASAAVITTPTEALPTVQSINVIPINVVPTEIVPAPALPPQAIIQEVSNAAVVVPQKIHWFDKLFGSAPKNPTQGA